MQLPTYPFQRQRYWVEFAANGHQKVASLPQNAQTPLLNLLLKGDTKQLAQQLETVGKLSGKLSDSELKLLPKLVDLLVQQNQQQLTVKSIKNWLYEVQWQPKPRDVEPRMARLYKKTVCKKLVAG